MTSQVNRYFHCLVSELDSDEHHILLSIVVNVHYRWLVYTVSHSFIYCRLILLLVKVKPYEVAI